MTNNTRLIQADDLYNMTAVEDPQVSPDAQWIAFVKRTYNRHQNTTDRAIWLVRPDGSDLRQFTNGASADTQPRWSPDGKRLAFVSKRGGKPQLYVMSVDGGEALPLTFVLNGATDPAWSPDGTRIAFLSKMRADELATEDETPTLPPATPWNAEEAVKGTEETEDERFDPRVIERIPYRAETSFWDERFSQVYVVPMEQDANGQRQPRRLTSAPRDHQAPRWSGDGEMIFCTASRKPEHDMPDLFNAVVRIRVADGDITELTGEGWTCAEVKPSPDGRWLAFRCQPDSLPLSQTMRLAVLPSAGGELRALTDALDRMVELHAWHQDSWRLLFTARDGGAVPVFEVPVEGGAPVKIAHEAGTVTGLDAGPDGLVASAAFTFEATYELYARSPDGENRPLTAFNRPFLDAVRPASLEHVRYAATDGTPLDGWLIKPPDYTDGQRYPLALNIHGGPAAMWGPSTPTMWLEWQHHAARGYVVFFCNPRGSSGYGQAFRLANQRDWGAGPTGDVLAGVDLLLERGMIDPRRLAITGGSYGGYLTAWIIGHEDRFAAAVAQRGVFHLHSFHGTTDIPLFAASSFQAEPWEAPEVYWAFSPLAHAHKITTPLLIIHSENDFRVPIAEAEQLFAVLKRAGQTVQLVRYPREGHELSRSGEPKHMIDRLERIVAWWARYCQGD